MAYLFLAKIATPIPTIYSSGERFGSFGLHGEFLAVCAASDGPHANISWA